MKDLPSKKHKEFDDTDLSFNVSFDDVEQHLEDMELTTVHGRITEVVGMLIKAIIPNVQMGEICMIKREAPPFLLKLWVLQKMNLSYPLLEKCMAFPPLLK